MAVTDDPPTPDTSTADAERAADSDRVIAAVQPHIDALLAAFDSCGVPPGEASAFILGVTVALTIKYNPDRSRDDYLTLLDQILESQGIT